MQNLSNTDTCQCKLKDEEVRFHMPGEHPGELGREFLNKVCFFLHGGFGFNVYQTSYEGEDAASVIAENEVVKFDIMMYQRRKRTLGNQRMEEYRVHFICECKWRSDPRDLKGKLREFLSKALKTVQSLQRRFSNNYYFMFICNKSFGVSQENLQDVGFIRKFLDEEIDSRNLQILSDKVGILILPDWFLDAAAMGS